MGWAILLLNKLCKVKGGSANGLTQSQQNPKWVWFRFSQNAHLFFAYFYPRNWRQHGRVLLIWWPVPCFLVPCMRPQLQSLRRQRLEQANREKVGHQQYICMFRYSERFILPITNRHHSDPNRKLNFRELWVYLPTSPPGVISPFPNNLSFFSGPTRVDSTIPCTDPLTGTQQNWGWQMVLPPDPPKNRLTDLCKTAP